MAKQFFEATSYGWLVWNPITRESVGLTAEYARVFARAVLGVDAEQQPLAPVIPPAEVEALRAERDRVARFLMERSPLVGAGDDPVGFLMASYAYTVDERNTLRATVAQLRESLEEIERDGFYGASDIARAALANAKGAGE